VGPCCSRSSQSMTLSWTLIFGYFFSKLATSDFQYGAVRLLYCAMTTLIVPLALPPELLLLPPPLLLPPQPAASATAPPAATAPADRAHRARQAPRLIDITKVPPGYPSAGQARLAESP